MSSRCLQDPLAFVCRLGNSREGVMWSLDIEIFFVPATLLPDCHYWTSEFLLCSRSPMAPAQPHLNPS